MIPPLPILLLWPVVVYYFYRRYDLSTALILSIVVGYLLLPHSRAIDLPVLPQFDKNSIPALSALIISAMVLQQSRWKTPEGVLPGYLPRHPLLLLLLAMLVGGAFLTPFFNSDPLIYPLRRLPGLAPYDAFSFALSAGVSVLPLLLARKFLAHPEAHRKLLVILAISGGLYAVLALYEVRMSPQLSQDVYGLRIASWQQHIRNGGFRPVVFLEHGLWLGIFLACAALAAIVSARYATKGKKARYVMAALFIILTITLSKTLGALMITLLLLPIALFLSVRTQMLAAAIVSIIVILYPPLRSADLVPVDKVVEFAGKISAERAGSLQFRLKNEDILLEKAMERPLFGWGGWGRSRVFDEFGNDLSVTDGRWVISFGVGGFVRYLGEFGLLAGPIILLAWRRKKLDLSMATSGVCLVLAANQIDLIPNAGLTPVTFLLAGALIGRLELQHVATRDQVPSAAGSAQHTGLSPTLDGATGKPAYTRFAVPPAHRKS